MKRAIILTTAAACLAGCSYRQDTTIVARLPNGEAWVENRTEENFMDGWQEYTVWGVNRTANPVCMVIDVNGYPSPEVHIVPANSSAKLYRRGSSGTQGDIAGYWSGVSPVRADGSCPPSGR